MHHDADQGVEEDQSQILESCCVGYQLRQVRNWFAFSSESEVTLCDMTTNIDVQGEVACKTRITSQLNDENKDNRISSAHLKQQPQDKDHGDTGHNVRMILYNKLMTKDGEDS